MVIDWLDSDGTIIVAVCPVNLLIIDSQGRKVGAQYIDGTFTSEVNEIEGAFYSGRNIMSELERARS